MKTITISAFLLAVIFAFSSCGKDGKLSKSTSDKIMGIWSFEKVKFHEDGRVSKKDVTDNFIDFNIQLTDNFEFIETNSATGIERVGIWKIERNSTYNGVNSGSYYESLSTVLSSSGSVFVEAVDWDYLCVSRNKITTQTRKDGGTYFYTLIRQ